MKQKEKAAVLRAAARDMDEGKSLSTGTAIWWALDVGALRDAYDLDNRFDELFAPRVNEQRHYWNDDWGISMRECGVLALCFAAAMAETGDL